jgi:hypothetical protein
MKMKTVIATMLLVATATAANAYTINQPTINRPVIASETNPNLLYESRARGTYSSSYGTTTIDSRLRVYQNPDGSTTTRYQSYSR